ncbi:integrase arm-type DNA-binding domain-containing protein [Campylobacter blaseri]|uniref:integrase arm-type DNA-binding domain-containing protein n=1 Tax=Campylobacter blaseri TaxID=2042961 RepID=UPI001F4E0A8F|nr:integrase arm-type DNA-binding domain-containing protein [Campylobacter blaseri]
MANKSSVYLTDKDIRNLEIKPKRYKKAVGEPKELYIWVNLKGSKIFFIKYKDKFNKEKSIRVDEFREGIYSVNEARRDIRTILNKISNGKTLQEIKNKNSDKYIFKNLFYRYIDIKKDKVSENYLKKNDK